MGRGGPADAFAHAVAQMPWACWDSCNKQIVRMKKTMFLLLAALMMLPAMTVAGNKVIVVMVDGFRWQELYRGADSALVNNKEFGNPDMMRAGFWRGTQDGRRRALMPFVWGHVAKSGVMIGNRDAGCRMSVTNNMWFSYPGYSETLCGYADDANIRSNDPLPNPNVTVFEAANNTPQYRGKVLVFGSWGRFIEIFNERRSGLEVNANYRHSLAERPTERELYVNKLQDAAPRYWEQERFDVFTHEYAVEAMRSRHPELMFVGYGDTDEWAHAGNYRLYLEAARNADGFIRELWETAQADPFYKDKTTFVVVSDHGRGTTADKGWFHHSRELPGSDQTWLMAFGAGIPAKGVLTSGDYHNSQVAATVASLLGISFAPKHEGAGAAIKF